MSMKEYKHINCTCGGIIGIYNGNTLNCDKCGTEYQLHKLDYDVLLTNDKTGWIFPMRHYEAKQFDGRVVWRMFKE